MLNQITKYIYIPIIVVLIIVFIIFIKKLASLMKNAAGINNKIDNLNSNLVIASNKKQEIEKSKDSYKFFFTIYVVLSVLRSVFKDYKHTSKAKRSIVGSFTKTCIKNSSKLSKIIINN